MNQKYSKPVRMIPLGGLGEIGLNCMILETDTDAIMIDCGVMFSDLDNFGIDFMIPDFTYLEGIKDKFRGIIITHGHEDHIGALPFALEKKSAPVYLTEFAHKLVDKKLEEYGLNESTEYVIYKPGSEMKIGSDFIVKPVWVNHSIIEATALIIETPQGKIVHTGDFKFDHSPYYGSPFDTAPFELAGQQGVRLLLSDSTNVERGGCSDSEKNVYHHLNELLPKVKGLTIVAVFASNIGRVGQILEIARSLNKKICFLGRSMEQNCLLAKGLGYLDGLQDMLIPLDEISNYDRSQIIVLSTGSQGEYRSGLVRISQNEHKFIKLQPGDGVILSSKFIPGNEKPIAVMINNLFRQGAEVFYEPLHKTHVTGHANADELKRMMTLTKPEYFVPVHGEYRHLVRHRQLAIETGIPSDHTFLVTNLQVWEISSDGLNKIDQLEEKRVFINGEVGLEIAKETLKERRKIAESGVIFVALAKDASGTKLQGAPQIELRGVTAEILKIDFIHDLQNQALAAYERWASTQNTLNTSILIEELRVHIRRYVNECLGFKPIVVPIVIDV